MWWPLSLTNIFKVIRPWLWKYCMMVTSDLSSFHLPVYSLLSIICWYTKCCDVSYFLVSHYVFCLLISKIYSISCIKGWLFPLSENDAPNWDDKSFGAVKPWWQIFREFYLWRNPTSPCRDNVDHILTIHLLEFWRAINMYLFLLSLIDIEIAQVVKIILGRHGSTYYTSLT